MKDGERWHSAAWAMEPHLLTLLVQGKLEVVPGGLPADAQVCQVETGFDRNPPELVLLLGSPAFEGHDPAAPSPRLNPRYERAGDKLRVHFA